MEWDDDGLEDPSGAPLLPPDDRLWRHPSEVTEAPPTAVRGIVGSTATGPPPRVVTVVALTSCISILITLGVVAVVRPFRTRAPQTSTMSGGLASVGDIAELTTRLRPAIGQVLAAGAGEDGGDLLGSGVIFREDGMMLTAHHIVDGASSVRVLLDDGRHIAARLVGGDPDTDIALLDLEGDSFPVAELAVGRADIGVGEPAITIGAGGTSSSTTASAGPLVRVSMVSAVGQEAGVDGRKLVDMIRTDSALAAGCSGGAVVDRTGRVIGIAAANVDKGDGVIGYATPIDVATTVAAQLMGSGKVERGWLGIEGETRGGALVQVVKADSPAAAAGLAAGDVITAVDGGVVASMSTLVAKLRNHKPGETVTLSVRRGDATVDLVATLAAKPA